VKKVLILIALLSLSPRAYSEAQDGKWTLSTGATVTSGDYGSSDTTEMYYLPVTLKYKTKKWKMKLTVPYLKIKGPQNVVRGIGEVGPPTTQQSTNEGLGDIIFSAGYQLFYLPESKTLLELTGKVKFGTADENKNLGTGKNDYSISLGFYKLMGDFTPYATIGRRFYNEPSDYVLDDVFFGSVGLGYKVSKKTSVGINLYMKEKTASTRTSIRQLSSYLSYKVDKSWKLQGYLINGLSENTPDLGGGFSLGYQFN
jgi:outer membrane putative beta-barrel porin/alpha-amylase